MGVSKASFSQPETVKCLFEAMGEKEKFWNSLGLSLEAPTAASNPL